MKDKCNGAIDPFVLVRNNYNFWNNKNDYYKWLFIHSKVEKDIRTLSGSIKELLCSDHPVLEG